MLDIQKKMLLITTPRPTVSAPLKTPGSRKRLSGNQMIKPDYYANLQIGPHFLFFHALCRLSEKLKKYKLTIPDTYCGDMETLLSSDHNMGYLTSAEPLTSISYQNSVISEATALRSKIQEDKEMDEMAYIILSKGKGLHIHTVYYY